MSLIHQSRIVKFCEDIKIKSHITIHNGGRDTVKEVVVDFNRDLFMTSVSPESPSHGPELCAHCYTIISFYKIKMD